MATTHRPSKDSITSSAPVSVLKVPERSLIVVRFLGPVRGVELHWHRGRHEPCGGPSDCPSSMHRLRIVWKGYAAAEEWIAESKLWRPCALEVTSHLEECLRGRQLRGEVWTVFREGDRGKHDPVYGVLCEAIDASRLRPAFDVLPIILRLYNVRSIRIDLPNLTPDRVILPAVSDAPPHLPADLVPQKAEEQSPEAREKLRQLWQELRAGLAGQTGGREPKPAEPGRNGTPAPRPAGR